MIGEPQVAASVTAGLDCLVPPLQHALGVGETAGLLGVRGGRQEEDLGPDVLRPQLAGLDFGAVFPPGRALDQREVAYDEPVQVRHPEPLHLAVRRPDGRVLPEEEVALALPGQLGHYSLVGTVAAGQPWQVAEAEVVLGGSSFTPPGLEQ